MIPARLPAPQPDHGTNQPERLLRCTADRTLLVRRRADGEAEELVKVFERGSLADAQREAELGRELELPGLVRYRSAGQDPATGRPCLVMDYYPGRDLEAAIAEQGPYPPRAAARIALQIARTLDSLHRKSTPAALHGLAHGDIKPGNILVLDKGEAQVLLLDLEHATALLPEEHARGRAEAGRFTGGTHGFAPPEAYLGIRQDRAFESFAFGATLHILLTGEPPFHGSGGRSIANSVQSGHRQDWLLAGLPEGLACLVRACLSSAPQARPTMSQAIDVLSSFLDQPPEDRILDVVLHYLHAGQLEHAHAQLRELTDPSPRLEELKCLLRRRQRLLQRRPLPEPLHRRDMLRDAEELLTAIPRLSAWLKRFPAHPSLLGQRSEYRNWTAELLVLVPPEVAAYKRKARFDEATELLDAVTRAVRLSLNLPGPLPARSDISARLPGRLQRDPLRFLQLALEDLQSAAESHSRLLNRLEQAETKLNLDEVAQVIEAMASVYGGASSVVADLKNRLHLLGFHLEEIGRPRQKLELLEEQLSLAKLDHDLTPLRDFLQLCAERAPIFESLTVPTRSGLRRLQRGLHDLLRGFPHLTTSAEAAVDALDCSLDAMSDLAWEMVEDAQTKLAAVPIPVRPLQSILNRLDSLRLLEVLVNRPNRSRADLLDEVESVRMKVQQARTTRDQIARGAEEAMARGHWTTALYDMQRAVKHLDLDDTETSSTDRDLIEKFEEVKRTKEEIETTVRHNVELARRYAILLDKPDSTGEERLQILNERQACLQLLVEILKGDRASPYFHDLRDVDVQIAQERSDCAQHLLDQTSDIDERLRVATTTLEALVRSDPDQKPVGRIQRLINHWQRHRDRAREEVADSQRHSRAALSRRCRILWLAIGGVTIGSAAVFFTWRLLA